MGYIMNNLIGMSLERSPGGIKTWKKFLETLGIRYYVSEIQPEKAANMASDIFGYSSEYCFFRKSCLGQYIDAIQQGCDKLLIPIKTKDNGLLMCNSSRFMATEVVQYNSDIEVINCFMSTNRELRVKEAYRVAKLFTKDEEKIEMAVDLWDYEEIGRVNVFDDDDYDNRLNIMQIGKINHFFDYTEIDSPMARYLTNKLGVHLIDPETMSGKDEKLLKTARRIARNEKISFHDNKQMYWPEHLIINAIISNIKRIDGIIFVRDCFCNAGLEEINILSKIVKEIEIPFIIVNYNLQAQSSLETMLDTFVQMLEIKKKRGYLCIH